MNLCFLGFFVVGLQLCISREISQNSNISQYEENEPGSFFVDFSTLTSNSTDPCPELGIVTNVYAMRSHIFFYYQRDDLGY